MSKQPWYMRKIGRQQFYAWPPPPADVEHTFERVTSITEMYNGGTDGLIWAATKIDAAWAHDNIDRWHDLPRDEAIKTIVGHFRTEWNRKRDRGTAVHAELERILMSSITTDEADMVDPDLLPWIAGGINFANDHIQRVIHVEPVIYNIRWQYGGKADAIVKLNDGRLAIIDWKTGAGVYPEQSAQLAAYANGEFIGFKDGTKTRVPPIDVGILVHLTGDPSVNRGYEAQGFDVSADGVAWDLFTKCRTLHAFKTERYRQVYAEEFTPPMQVANA